MFKFYEGFMSKTAQSEYDPETHLDALRRGAFQEVIQTALHAVVISIGQQS